MSSIHREFVKLALSSHNWWDRLSLKEQQAYIKQHRTRLKPTPKKGLSDSPTDGIFFHGFSKPEHLLLALQRNKFGDIGATGNVTSIGVKGKSYVPYYNTIYFKKNKAKLYPLLYGYSQAASEEDQAMIERVAKWLDIDPDDVKTGPMQYRSENEWYALNPLNLSDLDVAMVTISRHTDKNLAQKIKNECKKRNYPFTIGSWETSN